MLDSHYKLTGTVRIPTGEYSDNKPVFEDYAIKYIVFDGTFRHPQTGAQQAETTYYVKPLGETALPDQIPPGSLFVDHRGQSGKISTATRYYRNKQQELECFALTLVK